MNSSSEMSEKKKPGPPVMSLMPEITQINNCRRLHSNEFDVQPAPPSGLISHLLVHHASTVFNFPRKIIYGRLF